MGVNYSAQFISTFENHYEFATFFKQIYHLYVKIMVVEKEYVLSVLSTSV
jgi:hypothetical protein